MLKHTLGGLAAALLLASLQDARADMFESANAPGLCLNVVVGASSLQPCTGGLAQDFALHEDPATGSTLIVQGIKCVAMAGQGQMLQLSSSCSYEEIPPPSIQFTLSGGSVQANGLCLDVMGGGRKAGTKVIGFPCNGQRNQSWTIRQTGATVQSGFESLGDSITGARLSANNAPSMCIGIGPGGQAVLQSCNSAPVLDLFTGGVPTFIMAVDTANGSMNCLMDQGSQNQALRFENCSEAPSDYAKWGLTTNGLLRNEQGLCADVKGAGRAPGTPLIFFKCTGKQNQRFTLIEQ
jgi:hypothetical protein